ncbi:hypothetical protein Tco_0387797, partial [Tanacetum coccineum]
EILLLDILRLKQSHPTLSPKEPVDSLIMEDDHLDTIPETESDEFIKSSVENWNGYLRKGQKTKPKRQNWTRNGKAGKRQSPVKQKA